LTPKRYQSGETDVTGVRYLREFPTTEAATRKLVAKLAAKFRRLTFCYEAGPTGYGLYRLIKRLGHECIVAVPSLIPKKPGDRVKTNRRDAVSLTKLLRAGELTAVWVPDERHEAMRDLSRARLAANKDLQGKRQQISSLMRLGRCYPGRTTWGPRPGRSSLGLSASRARGPGEAAKGRGHTEACTRDRLESANAIVLAFSLAAAQGQAADGRRYGGCPRAIGLHLGDQSRGHANSTSVMSSGAVDHSSREVRSTGPQPLRCNQHQEG
jgi:hypothetical protein